MFRIAEYLQNRCIRIVLNNSIEIVGQLDTLIRPVRNIPMIALTQIYKNNELECGSELPRIKTYGSPPLILINSKIVSKDSDIITSKVFVRGHHICLICNNDARINIKNEGERMATFVTQNPGNVVKNKAFIKCQRIGCNN